MLIVLRYVGKYVGIFGTNILEYNPFNNLRFVYQPFDRPSRAPRDTLDWMKIIENNTRIWSKVYYEITLWSVPLMEKFEAIPLKCEEASNGAEWMVWFWVNSVWLVSADYCAHWLVVIILINRGHTLASQYNCPRWSCDRSNYFSWQIEVIGLVTFWHG